jgi:hypothetical protein
MRKLFSTTSWAVATALLAVSCRSTQTAYQFTPSPLEVLVSQGEDQPSVARVLVGIPGAQREGNRRSGRPELVVQVRIENQSADDIRFDPSRSQLLGSDLAEFGAAKPQPSGVTSISAGETKSVLVRYPFPQDGSLDAPLLTGVNLRLELDIEGGPSGPESVEVSASLERVDSFARVRGRNNVNWGLGYRGGWGYGLGRFGGRGIGFGFGNSFYGCW